MKSELAVVTGSVADAVEAWLNRPKNPQVLGSEIIQGEVRGFASQMEEIAMLMHEHPFDGDLNNGAWLTRDNSQNEVYMGQGMRGIGDGSLSLTDFHIAIPDTRDILGVDTQYVLTLDLHTDGPTMKVIEERDLPGEVRIGETEYYFDDDGHYGKISFLPADLVIPELVVPGHYSIEFMSQVTVMMPADFERVKYALQLLRSSLTKW